MNSPLRLVMATLSASLLLSACGAKSKEQTPQVSSNALVVDGSGVSLGGERIGEAPPDVLKKVDPLFAKLRERKEGWNTAHPSEPFSPALTIELGPDITCQAAISVYMSAVFAGFPKLTVKQGAITVDLPGHMPKPPSLEEPSPSAPREAFATFHPDGNAELKPSRCGGAYDIVPVASLAATTKEWCGEAADCLGGLQVVCDPGVPMSKVLPALDALRKGSAKMELGIGGSCPGGTAAPMGAFLGLSNPVAPDGDNVSPGLPSTPVRLPAGKNPAGVELREGAVIATGGLTAEEVRETMKPKLASITQCYEAGLLQSPNLQGRISTRLSIGKKGAVMLLKNNGSDMPSAGVVKCVVNVLEATTFPAKAAISTISYPLMFATK